MNDRSYVRRIPAMVAVVTALSAATVNAQQSLDNFTFHGSLTAAYAKSDGLGVLGIPKEGTFDYNLIALQFGYKFDEKNRVVVQLLHRSMGTSPLVPLMPELSPVWAFYERKAAGFAFKLGRSPLPHGIFNEVRFIGTLLPMFRQATYLETLENIDGIVVSRAFELGRDWSIDANAMVGEFDIKYVLPTATGSIAGVQRAKNSFGSQLWLRTPVKGLRVGVFADRFDFGTAPTIPAPKSPILVRTLSVDGDFEHGFLRAEWQDLAGGRGTGRTFYSNWYVQGGVKVTDKLTVLSEFNAAKTLLIPTPLPDIMLDLNKDISGAVNYSPSANVKYKFELHRANGYAFDTAVPTLIAPTKAPFVMTTAPRSKAVYGILSIAVSF
ncbi:MAG: hypothetical protein ABI120_21340 [Gemmatimonadaceae bacterium]